MDLSVKNILFKYWDKVGKIKTDTTILKMFHINPHKDFKMLSVLVNEWCRINNVSPYQPLKDDFKKLEETSSGVYESKYEGVFFHIKKNNYEFDCEVYKIKLDTRYDTLEIEAGVDFNLLRVNGEDVFNIPSDEMDDEEYFAHFDTIREDVFDYLSDFFYNKYGYSMGVDIELNI